jgi:two-component system phosphate regulon response regulator OmpR
MQNIEKKQKISECPHILVVDDDARICGLLSRYLRDKGFVAMEAHDAASAKELLACFSFDLLVVDVMMPGETGFELTKFIRARYAALPVLLLTALAETENKIMGFEAGADDYLAKPFEPQELLLRIQAILRRARPQKPQTQPDRFKIGAWYFDTQQPFLEKEGQSIKLTTMELTLIMAFLQYPGQVVSRDDLAEACGLDAGERTIDVQVTRLRRKLEDDAKNPRILLTVRGKGYLMRAEGIADE